MRVVGLDLSLTGTGVAVVYPNGTAYAETLASAPFTHTPQGEPGDSLEQRDRRLSTLASKIVGRVGHAGLVVIEAPAYASTVGMMHDRSGLWWLVVRTMHRRGVPIAEVAPTARAKYGTGNGRASKKEVLVAARERYEVRLDNDNEADAMIVASMGRRHIGQPVDGDLPARCLASMDAVRWPELVSL